MKTFVVKRHNFNEKYDIMYRYHKRYSSPLSIKLVILSKKIDILSLFIHTVCAKHTKRFYAIYVIYFDGGAGTVFVFVRPIFI